MEYVRSILLLLTVAICSSLNFKSDTKHSIDINYGTTTLSAEAVPKKPAAPFAYFMAKMALLESLDNYTIVNRYGYIGKYQFSVRTLRGLKRSGYLNVSNEDIKHFRYRPEIQEQAMRALIRHNLHYLKRSNMLKYIGKEIGGVKITMRGMLAASHLVGPYGAKQFILSGGRINKKDANGTSVRDYMKEFEV